MTLDFYQIRTQGRISQNSESVRKIVRAMRNTHSWLQTHTAEEVLNLLPEQFHSDSREADLATLRVLMAGLSHDGRMPSGAPENVRRLLSASIPDAGKVDLAATWTNEFVNAP